MRAALTILSALLVAPAALAQEAPPSPEAKRIAELEQRLCELERRMGEQPLAPAQPGPPAPEPAPPTPEPNAPTPAPSQPTGANPAGPAQPKDDEIKLELKLETLNGYRVEASPGKGFTIVAPEDRFAATVRARLQLRDTYLMQGDKDTNELNVRTVRLITHGHILSKSWRYLIQLAFGSNDYEGTNHSPIFDAFLESTHHRDLNVRVGQFFVPFDRQRTTREFALNLVDRPLVVRELTLDRDVGVMLSSSDLFGAGVLGYHIFVGGGEGRNRFGGAEPGPLVVGRLTAHPFGAFDEDSEGDLERKEELRVALGVAGGYNYRTSRAQSTFGNTLTAGVVDYVHAAADLVLKYGGFSLQLEGVYRHGEENSVEQVVNGVATRQFSRSGHGYFVQAGMMATDELELVGRWEQLVAEDRRTDPALRTLARQTGRQVGGGVNYYLNGHAFKVQLDYFYLFGHNDESAKDHQVRLQLDVSF